MRNAIRTIRNLGIYLLPASSLSVAIALLLAFLYYPGPATVANSQIRADATVEHWEWQAHADAWFAALLDDALRQLQAEQETRARTLRYQYEDGLSSGEAPVLLWIAPPPATGPARETGRPTLIHL